MHLHVRSRVRKESGAAAVEFALVAVILLTLITGVIQFAIYFWAYEVGAHAAREGARQYAVNPCGGSTNVALIKSRVGSAAASYPAGDPSATISGQTAGVIEVGDEATVTLEFKTHVIGGLLPALPTIKKVAVTRIEYVPVGCS